MMSATMLFRRGVAGSVSTTWRRPSVAMFGTSSTFTCSSTSMSTSTSTTTTAVMAPSTSSSFASSRPWIRGDHRHDCFSSMATKAAATPRSDIVELPPNLKFHPKSKSSPFYGLEPIPSKSKKERKGKSAKETAEAAAPAISAEPLENDEGDLDFDDDDDDDSESDRLLYDLSSSSRQQYAIPLPQRLHVPIHSFHTGPTSHLGTLHLSPHTFGLHPIRIDLLHRCVVYQRNKRRGKRNAGAITKTISTVRGSTRKVRQQKGSGRARAGHARPPHWRGGAKAHGPKGKVQDYTTKLNKKVRKLGVRHALSQKLKEGNLILVDGMRLESHKTGGLVEILERFGVGGGKRRKGDKALLIDDLQVDENENDDGEGVSGIYQGLDVNLTVAAGNLYEVKVINQRACNVYELLKYKKVIMTLEAMQRLEEKLERNM
mmetsp:Transcript_7032/g.15137  ORF Transcript_7032/g.15137 Transcript_7032/m.15137 type:complete len:431 (+) Transcript_7032:129-1421(+)